MQKSKAKAAYFVSVSIYIPDRSITNTGFLSSFVMGGKKMKCRGVGAFRSSTCEGHLVDVSRDDGKNGKQTWRRLTR